VGAYVGSIGGAVGDAFELGNELGDVDGAEVTLVLDPKLGENVESTDGAVVMLDVV
jgi:hypothetical protein